MIELTKLNNQLIYINPNLICSVEKCPDVTIQLTTGDRLVVKNSIEDIQKKMIEFQKKIITKSYEDIIL